MPHRNIGCLPFLLLRGYNKYRFLGEIRLQQTIVVVTTAIHNVDGRFIDVEKNIKIVADEFHLVNRLI